MEDSFLLPLESRLINFLVIESKASEEELLENREIAISKQLSFKDQLSKTNLVNEQQYQRAMAGVTGMDYLEKIEEIPAEKLNLFTDAIPIQYAKKFCFFPVLFNDDYVLFAVESPWPRVQYADAAEALGVDYDLAISSREIIMDGINRAYDRTAGTAEEAAETLDDDEDLKSLSELSTEEAEDLLESEDEEPIKKLMNSILFQSVKDGSSDIHIDPSAKETLVRYRIDGFLHKIATVPRQGHIPLLNRVKVMSGLDISTKNQTQDGRTMILLAGRKIDIRVSILPTIHGERAVLRLLNQSKGLLSLESMGMSKNMVEQLDTMINQPHGILLVTGPTGSGKTTSLYAALSRIDKNKKNIITVEDPVEYKVAGYGQVQVNEKVGLTFAQGLRSILRQDPDVIMVGEIRDGETAQIAIQSALTGHMVLSTLHTNDSPSTVVRLLDMGIEPFLVSSTVNGIIAQRLVRRICPHCKEEVEVDSLVLKKAAFPARLMEKFQGKLWQGKGCEKCHGTGYLGRVGIFELLIMNDEIRQAVVNSCDAIRIKQEALKSEMTFLADDCAEKILQGITTIEEMIRVVYADDE